MAAPSKFAVAVARSLARAATAALPPPNKRSASFPFKLMGEQKWCMEREVCTDDIDAVHLLNRMLERGLLHHCRLNKLVENSDTAYYRFPQDHFKVRTYVRAAVRRN